LYPTTITTSRPRTGTLRPPARPLLDGLTWLWRTWQDTAPGAQAAGMTNSGRTKTRASAYTAPSGAQPPNAPVNFDEGLDSDTAAQPLAPNSEATGSFGSGLPGGQLLSAALGVTRAVTQFLGAALQGAGRTIQTAWSTQALGSAGPDSGYFRLSGR